jgi:hypothetical protein
LLEFGPLFKILAKKVSAQNPRFLTEKIYIAMTVKTARKSVFIPA